MTSTQKAIFFVAVCMGALGLNALVWTVIGVAYIIRHWPG